MRKVLIQVGFDPELLDRIDKWRAQESEHLPRAKAIRMLVLAGMKAHPDNPYGHLPPEGGER